MYFSIFAKNRKISELPKGEGSNFLKGAPALAGGTAGQSPRANKMYDRY